ncbi:hypothetical protein NQT65_19195 [Pseudoalteromonas agarivorans]|uniref:hypothetical protein n=1 Tax=Pseudoalteromonas agarivorans TaxID=176102 RepID=UPI002119592D|nr:hypothetical protein [Pseudoalteromonas agarivorans]MCQ8822321.1 hypothetical protein [Pseudoalteromonas agarivorans]
MIKDIIDEFHEHRLADEHEKAMEPIKILKSRYTFSEDEIVATLVNEDFLEDECVEYLETHSQKRVKE